MPRPLPSRCPRARSSSRATAATAAPMLGRGHSAGSARRRPRHDRRRRRRHADHRRAGAAVGGGRRHPDLRQPQPAAVQRPEAVLRRGPRAFRPRRGRRCSSATAPWPPTRWVARRRPAGHVGKSLPVPTRSTATLQLVLATVDARANPQPPVSACCWTPTTARAACWAGGCWTSWAADVTMLGGEPDGQFEHPPEPTAENLAGVLLARATQAAPTSASARTPTPTAWR